jgi:hypothetical protein
VHGKLPDAVRRLPGVPPSALHQDRGMALLSAFAAVSPSWPAAPSGS